MASTLSAEQQAGIQAATAAILGGANSSCSYNVTLGSILGAGA